MLRKAEEKLARANSAPVEMATLRMEIGEALSARGKAAEAAPFYIKALDHLAMVASPDPAGSVAQTQKLLPIVLAGLAPDKGVETVAKYKASPVEGVAAAVAEAATKYAENLSEGGDPVAALQWIDALAAKVPDKFGVPFVARIDAARAKAVVANNTQKLKSDTDKAGATETILALGPLAVKPLAEQLKIIVSAEKPDEALENAIWALITQLSPAALQDKPRENKDQKLAAVDGLINGE
jgi:hypothetical protein